MSYTRSYICKEVNEKMKKVFHYNFNDHKITWNCYSKQIALLTFLFKKDYMVR